MKRELDKVYEPQKVEERLYKFWNDSGFFHAQIDENKQPYTIVIPPPNITGQLHMGHALDETLQDILIRYRRMQGRATLWLPGTDHASIATEAKIVAAMAKEGLTKDDLGREGFLERAWEWKRQYGGRIVEQLKKLGSSCDWQRERFTLDDGCNKAVNEVFCRLYEKGLIYRGERIVNWCPTCLTSISDAEVEYSELDGSFWHIRYPLSDNSGYVEVATTRPETMLGDTAVAVHPDDSRYKHLIGKTVILPLLNKQIPIIADSYVEMEFGTGVVKITPAHDPNDFEVGLRHNLPVINVMTDNGYMNEQCGKYFNMERYQARKAIVDDLEQQGYLVKVKPVKHNVGKCYRCSTVIEPRISKQWFVKMEPLAKPAIKAVKEGKTKFVPERFDKIYFNWMENIKDWCISRQLWWGHQIPAWYCEDCKEIIVAREQPHSCPKCQSSNLRRDPDTLDTWFSSALWPFSTLGWPDNTEELKYFYPTNTLVTGYDIIFFWVSRMIFSALEYTDQVPFDTVLIHGLVRDAQGRKMSKSLGNGIDPLEEIERYGADALRFTLATGNAPGNDMRYSPERVESSRNFANKLWNAARFVMMNLPDDEPSAYIPKDLSMEDKWVLSKFNRLAKEVTENLDKFEIGIAVSKLYDFIWDVYCDWYIEICKVRLNAQDDKAKTARGVLVYVMTGILQLLHPFMPFITEEIWQTLPHEGESIMISKWPEFDENLEFTDAEREFERIMNAIGAVRARRAEMNVPPSKKAKVYIDTAYTDTFNFGAQFFVKLASASECEVSQSINVENAVSIITDDAKIYIPLGELIDFEAEKARLNKERDKVLADIDFVNSKLNNPGFVAKAPQKVIDAQKEQLVRHKEKLNMIDERLEALK